MKKLKDKTEKDLNKMMLDKRESLRVFRFSMSGGAKARNVKEGRTLRKEIAQIMTELSSRKTKN